MKGYITPYSEIQDCDSSAIDVELYMPPCLEVLILPRYDDST